VLVARVRRTILERSLIARGDHVLVGCSGGPDSLALVHALEHLSRELGVTLAVASIDHGLRAESEAEVETVRACAASLDLAFVAARLTLEPGPSLQARARTARYEALLRAARDLGAGSVAVGHTMDDQAETVLHRLVRGASIAGLAAIDPSRADGIVRPLIDARRADVDDYLRHHRLVPIQDPSNRDRRFTRARLRAEILPALERENPRVIEQLAELADEARDVARLLESRGAIALEGARIGAHTISIARLAEISRPERLAALSQWVAGSGPIPSRAQLFALDRLLRSEGEVRLADARTVIREGETLVLR
jgi:tRNA(Ile)-lysidine synthase